MVVIANKLGRRQLLVMKFTVECYTEYFHLNGNVKNGKLKDFVHDLEQKLGDVGTNRGIKNLRNVIRNKNFRAELAKIMVRKSNGIQTTFIFSNQALPNDDTQDYVVIPANDIKGAPKSGIVNDLNYENGLTCEGPQNLQAMDDEGNCENLSITTISNSESENDFPINSIAISSAQDLHANEIPPDPPANFIYDKEEDRKDQNDRSLNESILYNSVSTSSAPSLGTAKFGELNRTITLHSDFSCGSDFSRIEDEVPIIAANRCADDTVIDEHDDDDQGALKPQMSPLREGQNFEKILAMRRKRYSSAEDIYYEGIGMAHHIHDNSDDTNIENIHIQDDFVFDISSSLDFGESFDIDSKSDQEKDRNDQTNL